MAKWGTCHAAPAKSVDLPIGYIIHYSKNSNKKRKELFGLAAPYFQSPA